MGQLRSEVFQAARSRRAANALGTPNAPAQPLCPPRMVDVQRARILRAAARAACELGAESTPVGVIVAGAGVSRKTFYDLFDDREDCMLAVFEQAVELATDAVLPAYAAQRGWAPSIRAALVELLGLIERERDLATLALQYMVGGFARDAERRVRVLERLRAALDDGRLQGRAHVELSPLTAEVVLGGVLAVIEARLRDGRESPMSLVNPLMWMIALPYLGTAAAARELRRALPRPARAPRVEPARNVLEGLEMRMTYRTASVLAAAAERAGRNNMEISERVGIADQGQMSKLLARLERLGLLENTGGGHAHGQANAWHLSSRGRQVERALSREFAAGQARRGDLPRGARRERIS